MTKQKSEAEILKIMMDNPRVRKAVVRRSFRMFFSFYFGQFMDYPLAPFQKEMMALAENKDVQNLVVAGFRNSAKSTILSLAFVIWAVLGEHRVKHVLIGSKTQPMAQMLLQHIKDALAPDSLLKRDLGPFQEFKAPWNISSIVIKRLNARIAVISTEQSIRGIRHGKYRPQLIVLDDVEDIESVKTQESRDKMFEWLTREVIPSGDRNTRLLFVGNRLHDDSVMMRLQRAITSGAMSGEVRTYPALDANGIPLWIGKYPDKTSVEAEKLRGMTELAYRREILLEIIPEGAQIIDRKDLKFYDPDEKFGGYRFSLVAIDPAAKTNAHNDCTAIVCADIYGHGRDMRIRIKPNPVNARLTYDQVVDRVVYIVESLGGSNVKVCVESVGFQDMFLPLLRDRNVIAEGVPVHGKSKDDRLLAAAMYIQNGIVQFAKTGNEEMINQTLYLGSGEHDDLVDALSLVVLQSVEYAKNESGFLEYARKQNEERQRLGPAVFTRPRGLADWVAMARRHGAV